MYVCIYMCKYIWCQNSSLTFSPINKIRTNLLSFKLNWDWVVLKKLYYKDRVKYTKTTDLV